MEDYERRSWVETLRQCLFCVILAIYGLNIFNRYVYISYIVIVICFAYLILRKEMHLSWQTLFVFVFLGLYWALSFFINSEERTELILECLTFYFFGAITYLLAANKQQNVFSLILSGAIGFGVYGIVTSFTAVLDSGRYMQDIWGGGRLAATQVAGWCMIFMATVPWIIIKGNKIKIWVRIILYTVAVLSIVSFFILSSRTGLVVTVIVVIFSFALAVKNKQRKTIICLIGLITIGIIVFLFDIGGVQSIFWNSNLILRMLQKQNENGSIFFTGRTERWIYTFKHFFEHMGGGYYYSKQLGGKIHNFFLDLYDECGIFALCAVAPMVIRLIDGLKKIHKRDIEDADKEGIISWFIIIAILFMTEPVLYYGRTNLMAFFFFMVGIVEFSGVIAYREEQLCDEVW